MGPSRGIFCHQQVGDVSWFFGKFWGLIISDYPLVNVYITVGRSTIFHGKTHYKSMAIFSIAIYVCLPGRVMGIDHIWWSMGFIGSWWESWSVILQWESTRIKPWRCSTNPPGSNNFHHLELEMFLGNLWVMVEYL